MNIADLRELIQDDVIACCDGFLAWNHPELADQMTDALCKIVVHRIKEYEQYGDSKAESKT